MGRVAGQKVSLLNNQLILESTNLIRNMVGELLHGQVEMFMKVTMKKMNVMDMVK